MRISDWSSDVCSSDLSQASSQATLADDPAVLHLDDPPASFGERWIMGDDEQGRAGRVLAREEQVDDGRAGRSVQIAGRFVCEDDRQAGRNPARDGNALLLAPGKLRRIVMETKAKPHGGPFFRGTGEGVGQIGRAQV